MIKIRKELWFGFILMALIIAGTAVMLLSARTDGDVTKEAVVLGALVTALLLTLLCLLAAGPMMKLMGAKFEGALTRLLGVVLAALERGE